MNLGVWNNREYYLKAKGASLASWDHPGLVTFREVAKEATRVLEVGVGEGSKLRAVTGVRGLGVGVDVSLVGLKIAQGTQISKLKTRNYNSNVKKNPEYRIQHREDDAVTGSAGSPQVPFIVKSQKLGGKSGGLGFIQADGGKLPFEDNSFDFVYSAFTLEHLDKPEEVIREMVRVARKGGGLGFLAPNFGAPNRASPCFEGSRVKKLLVGLAKDFSSKFKVQSSKLQLKFQRLDWDEVKPIATEEQYEIDWDTVVEPYVLSLMRFLESLGVEMEEVSSCWEMDLNTPVWQLPLRWLGKMGVYPFRYWGPHLLVVGYKL
jgi:SAM-dependent methyltransferase